MVLSVNLLNRLNEIKWFLHRSFVPLNFILTIFSVYDGSLGAFIVIVPGSWRSYQNLSYVAGKRDLKNLQLGEATLSLATETNLQ